MSRTMNQEQLKNPSGNLLHNLILFGRLLRGLGIDVNPGRMIDLVQALDYVEIGRRDDFYYTARSLLVHKQEELALFEQAFKLFWQASRGIELSLSELLPAPPPKQKAVTGRPALEQNENSEPPTSDDNQDEQEIIDMAQSYSRQELLRQKDFGQMTAAEQQEVRQFMARLVWQLDQRRTRRKRQGRRGQMVDMRRLLRKNLRYGGELLEWPRRELKPKPRPLVIIADISGSMEQYTRLLLYFIYSLSRGLEQVVEGFVFSTRLTPITRQLRSRELNRALNDIAAQVSDWAGGTRIGDALKTFNFEWGRRVLGRGAVVLLISDGWDRGDPELLRREIARLQRSCHRLIWLNPLLGSANYEPLTRGMQAALPYIDDFLPVHNLVSLEALADHLLNLTTESRRLRRSRMKLSGAAFVK